MASGSALLGFIPRGMQIYLPFCSQGIAVYFTYWCVEGRLKMDAGALGSQQMGSCPITELSAGGPFESHDILWKYFSYVKINFCPVILLNY